MKINISLSALDIPLEHQQALEKIRKRANKKKPWQRDPAWLSPYIFGTPDGYRHISDGRTFYGSITPDRMLVPSVQPPPPNHLPPPTWTPPYGVNTLTPAATQVVIPPTTNLNTKPAIIQNPIGQGAIKQSEL